MEPSGSVDWGREKFAGVGLLTELAEGDEGSETAFPMQISTKRFKASTSASPLSREDMSSSSDVRVADASDLMEVAWACTIQILSDLSMELVNHTHERSSSTTSPSAEFDFGGRLVNSRIYHFEQGRDYP